MLIRELFSKPIDRPINGVIKADQDDAASVWQELDEYVVTKELDIHLRKFITAYLDAIFERFEKLPHWTPLIERARNKMASRDLAFRDALHKQLEEQQAHRHHPLRPDVVAKRLSLLRQGSAPCSPRSRPSPERARTRGLSTND